MKRFERFKRVKKADRQRWSEKIAAHGSGMLLLNATGFEAAWFQHVLAESLYILLPHRRINFSRPRGQTCKPPAGQILIGFGVDDLEAMRTWNEPALHLAANRITSK